MSKADKTTTESIEQSAVLPLAAEELLNIKQSIRFTAAGNSMHPTIKQGDTLIIEPCDPQHLSIGDIVLFNDNERLLAHRIISIKPNTGKNAKSGLEKAFSASKAETVLLKSCCGKDAPETNCSLSESDASDPLVQCSAKRQELCFVSRGDFRSNPDPPIFAAQILGKVVAIERNHKIRSPYGIGKQLFARTYRISSQIKSFLSL